MKEAERKIDLKNERCFFFFVVLTGMHAKVNIAQILKSRRTKLKRKPKK
jgi:hypothetical protein